MRQQFQLGLLLSAKHLSIYRHNEGKIKNLFTQVVVSILKHGSRQVVWLLRVVQKDPEDKDSEFDPLVIWVFLHDVDNRNDLVGIRLYHCELLKQELTKVVSPRRYPMAVNFQMTKNQFKGHASATQLEILYQDIQFPWKSLFTFLMLRDYHNHSCFRNL